MEVFLSLNIALRILTRHIMFKYCSKPFFTAS